MLIRDRTVRGQRVGAGRSRSQISSNVNGEGVRRSGRPRKQRGTLPSVTYVTNGTEMEVMDNARSSKVASAPSPSRSTQTGKEPGETSTRTSHTDRTGAITSPRTHEHPLVPTEQSSWNQKAAGNEARTAGAPSPPDGTFRLRRLLPPSSSTGWLLSLRREEEPPVRLRREP